MTMISAAPPDMPKSRNRRTLAFRRPPRYGGDHRAQLIVCEHQVGGLPGHLGSSPSHGHANISMPERRPVVHTVSSHGDDLAGASSGIDDGHFLFGSARAMTGASSSRS